MTAAQTKENRQQRRSAKAKKPTSGAGGKRVRRNTLALQMLSDPVAVSGRATTSKKSQVAAGSIDPIAPSTQIPLEALKKAQERIIARRTEDWWGDVRTPVLISLLAGLVGGFLYVANGWYPQHTSGEVFTALFWGAFTIFAAGVCWMSFFSYLPAAAALLTALLSGVLDPGARHFITASGAAVVLGCLGAIGPFWRRPFSLWR